MASLMIDDIIIFITFWGFLGFFLWHGYSSQVVYELFLHELSGIIIKKIS